MADAAFNFITLNFDCRLRRQLRAKAGGSFLNRLEFRPPGASDGDAACVHGDRGPVSAVYWQIGERFVSNLGGLRKRGGKDGGPASAEATAGTKVRNIREKIKNVGAPTFFG